MYEGFVKQVHHENVVRLLDYYQTPAKLYFVMELATGTALTTIFTAIFTTKPQALSKV